MISKASICSVTRIVPILEVINDPTFPAIITEINVGANSKITDCLEAKPINSLGISGFVKLSAVCIATTPPTKKEINATIPNDPIMRSSMSLKIKPLSTEPFVGFIKVCLIIKKYFPIWCRYAIDMICFTAKV